MGGGFNHTHPFKFSALQTPILFISMCANVCSVDPLPLCLPYATQVDGTEELLELVFDDEWPLFGEDSVPARVEGSSTEELWLCLFGLEPIDEAVASRLAEAMARCEPTCVLLSGGGAGELACALRHRPGRPGTRTQCVDGLPAIEAVAALISEGRAL